MQKDFNKYQKEISEIFGFKIPLIKVKVAKDRRGYEKIVGKKTESWEVGRMLKDKRILVLDPKVWHIYAPEHRPEEFPLLVRHEMIHVYTYALTDKGIPMWLMEGLAGTLSGQYKYSRIKKVPNNFCKKFESAKNWSKSVKLGAYPVSFKFVAYLISKYNFEKIKKLIELAPKKYTYVAWNNTANMVFKKNLSELEADFKKEMSK